MGYFKHHSIIVTCRHEEHLIAARNKAIEIFGKHFERYPIGNGVDLISPVISGVVNSQTSFFIAPDGSKEGWEPSNNGDNARAEFLDWLRDEKDNNYCNYAEIVFGGDDDFEEITRSTNEKEYD